MRDKNNLIGYDAERERCPVLIHIGFHKTASTWLQRAIFDNSEYGFAAPWSREQTIKDFVKADVFEFDSNYMHAEYETIWREAERKGVDSSTLA